MSAEQGNRTKLIEWGIASRSLPGERVSGDLHLVKPFRNGVLVALIDGVGHGGEATAAARAAAAALTEYPMESPIWLVKRCHECLVQTRGAVMTLATFHAIEGTITWLGVGNVEGVLFRADLNADPAIERVLLRGGLVGYHLPPLHASVIPVCRGDMLVLATDGVRNDFVERRPPFQGSPQQTADRLMAKHFKGSDDAFVLAAFYLGAPHE